MTPKLEKCFTMRGYLDLEDNSHQLGPMKGSLQRIIVPISSGFLEGSGLKAELRPGGGDWQLLDTSANIANLDVRLNARTGDGHSMHVHYTGFLKMDEKASSALSGGSQAKTTEFGDHEWWIGPNMETSDAKFKWIESMLWIGQGRFVVDDKGVAVEYQVFKAMN